MDSKEEKKALVLMVENSEDVEVVTITYCLRLAEVSTILAGVEGNNPVKCIKGVTIVPDMSLEEAKKLGPFDIILIPGGIIGADTLAKNSLVAEVLKEHESKGKLIAAICCGSAYTITGHKIYEGRKLTTYPQDNIVSRVLETKTHQLVPGKAVVIDGPLITGMGPYHCYEFILKVIKELSGEAAEKLVKDYILWKKLD